MTLSELITAARARLDDEATPYRWSDTQISSWANEANIEACRRIKYLIDNTKTVSVVSGTSGYAYPSGMIYLRRAILSTEDTPLRFTSYKELDENMAGWETHTGTPERIIVDYNTDKFYLYPEPDANGTLNLTCVMEPSTYTTTTQIPSRFGYALLDWVMFRAYGLGDNDKQNRDASLEYLAAFTAEFGEKVSARNEVFDSRNLPLDNYDGTW